MEYCKEKGIEPKCHCLNYDNFLPNWLSDATVDHHKSKLMKRFQEISEHYAYCCKAQNGITAFRGFYGDYKLTVHAGGKTIPAQFTLGKHKNNTLEILL